MASNKKATKDEEVKAEVIQEQVINPLQPRIHFNEFVVLYANDLSEMQKAGFKVFAGNKEWMRKDQWMSELESYRKEN